jgi:2-polyprenyl-3-methyl-5-hydroxy-6-metoxy-1,4-benzoquinol methylase
LDCLIHCPICHGSDTADEYPNARGPASACPLVRCNGCGLVFQKYARSDAAVDEAHSTAYGEPTRRFAGPVEAAVRRLRLARVRAAERLMPPGGSVLDIGCGRAVFLRLLKERGYTVRGTEYSEATARNADPAVPVDVGDVEPGRYADGSFDLVSVWHVLEHLRRPDVALQACQQALRPGGALMIAVPNYASIQARLGGEQWFHLDLPRHIYHFTPDTLHRLLEETGFEIERSRTGQWEMDPFGLLQTVLNRTGLRHNGLYDTLRNSEEDKRDLSPLFRASMLALLAIGLPPAAAASGLFRLLGRAGTLIIVARRPNETRAMDGRQRE